MKHQGKEGFTWDSKAEEWRDWCASVIEHDKPRFGHLRDRLHDMHGEYALMVLLDERREDERRREALDDLAALDQEYGLYDVPSANQWSDPDPYRVISWRDEPRKAPLWPFVVIAVIATLLVAWQAGYL